jgi:hypothetical protein
MTEPTSTPDFDDQKPTVDAPAPSTNAGSSRKRTRLILGLVLAIVVLGGGTGTYVAWFRPSDVQGSTAPTGSALFGDVATLDPCSAVPPGTFSGRVEQQPFQFDGCVIRVTPPGSSMTTQIKLIFTPVDLPALAANAANIVTKDGTLTLVKQRKRPSPLDCFESLSDPNKDSAMVAVVPDPSANAGSDASHGDLCAVADTVLAVVSSAAAQGRLGHLTFPRSSLGSVDACSLLTATSVHDVTGAVVGVTSAVTQKVDEVIARGPTR